MRSGRLEEGKSLPARARAKIWRAVIVMRDPVLYRIKSLSIRLITSGVHTAMYDSLLSDALVLYPAVYPESRTTACTNWCWLSASRCIRVTSTNRAPESRYTGTPSA